MPIVDKVHFSAYTHRLSFSRLFIVALSHFRLTDNALIPAKIRYHFQQNNIFNYVHIKPFFTKSAENILLRKYNPG